MESQSRVMVGVRIAPSGLARIDELAEVEEVSRSEMIRRLLKAGMQRLAGPVPTDRGPWA